MKFWSSTHPHSLNPPPLGKEKKEKRKKTIAKTHQPQPQSLTSTTQTSPIPIRTEVLYEVNLILPHPQCLELLSYR